MQVDEKATEKKRAAIRASRPPIETFTFGPTPEPIGIVRNFTQPAAVAPKAQSAAAD
jgi:hypothetical protein